MAAGNRWQKKLICKHSSNEVSLAAAFVPTLTMGRVIWIPLRRAKWPPIERGEHTGSEASLFRQCGQSNYDIIFLQDFSRSSHFTQRAWNWAGVRWRKLRRWRVSGFQNVENPTLPSGNFCYFVLFAMLEGTILLFHMQVEDCVCLNFFQYVRQVIKEGLSLSKASRALQCYFGNKNN